MRPLYSLIVGALVLFGPIESLLAQPSWPKQKEQPAPPQTPPPCHPPPNVPTPVPAPAPGQSTSPPAVTRPPTPILVVPDTRSGGNLRLTLAEAQQKLAAAQEVIERLTPLMAGLQIESMFANAPGIRIEVIYNYRKVDGSSEPMPQFGASPVLVEWIVGKEVFATRIRDDKGKLHAGYGLYDAGDGKKMHEYLPFMANNPPYSYKLSQYPHGTDQPLMPTIFAGIARNHLFSCVGVPDDGRIPLSMNPALDWRLKIEGKVPVGDTVDWRADCVLGIQECRVLHWTGLIDGKPAESIFCIEKETGLPIVIETIRGGVREFRDYTYEVLSAPPTLADLEIKGDPAKP